MLYKFGRLLQLLRLLIAPAGIVGNIAQRDQVPEGTMLLILAAGARPGRGPRQATAEGRRRAARPAAAGTTARRHVLRPPGRGGAAPARRHGLRARRLRARPLLLALPGAGAVRLPRPARRRGPT